ncbi:glycosyltransferase [uncultured Amaricoccus sp.]|uniref:glycosyltransferase n=2 Tax=Amaricoccus TaxID=56999 RepID=UPI002615987A|nr:glycosyltransferase [uncultured Amaricoccus sp.]
MSRPQSATVMAAQDEPAALSALQDARVAIVHDWCPDFRGGERVLARLCRLFPGADVFTLFDFLDPDVKARHFPGKIFRTSPLNRLPGVRRYYRHLFALCPFFIEQFDVTGYDLVLSSSSAFARGVLTRPDQPHVCYVHSPARYAWDEQFTYLDQAGLGFGPKGLLYRYMLHGLRTWDVRTAHGPDLMAANSEYVRARIRRIYGRDALVIHPPVDVEEMPFTPRKGDYYVAASFLAPYKRTDLVLRAFREMPDRKLLVVGEGQQSAALRALAAPNITFTGYLERQQYVDAVRNAKAMVFAGCEDFGIALAEAQASGTPLIAFAQGGARDIVRPLGSEHPTGVLFPRQSAEAIRDAVETFEHNMAGITPSACRQNAQRFSTERFDREVLAAVAQALAVRARDLAGAPAPLRGDPVRVAS